ncbi:MAG: hypothetical protein IJP54_06385 [Synergistaceae bacterium]|nr:hypothetical protein [Synergistaceae bacterium]
MINLEDFLKPTQKELFNLLRKKYRGEAIARFGSYILVPGKAPIMLLAHMDTVHEKPVKYICKSADGDILMSPQGIGGDDRCGVYALVKAYDTAPVKPWVLFTCDDEIGGLGAEKFSADCIKGKLPKGLGMLKLLVEIDRKGKKDAVYYSCDNPEFEKYIMSKGFVTAYGSFSDISVIAPAMGVAAVNLSSGYYNAHTFHEYISRKQIEAVIQSVVGIIADAAKPDFPKYEYIEKVYELTTFTFRSGYGMWDEDGSGVWNAKKVPLSSKIHVQKETIPSDLPSYMTEMYNDLLEFYAQEELEWHRKEFGDQIICQLYDEEFGPFFDTEDTLDIEDDQSFDWHRGGDK